MATSDRATDPIGEGSAGAGTPAAAGTGSTTPGTQGSAGHPADEARAPRWLVASAGVGVPLLVLAALVWLVAELSTKVTLLLVAIFVGLLLAGVFAPVVRWAARRGVPRGVSAAVAVVVILLGVGGAAVGIGARVQEQLPQLRDQLQSASEQLSQTLGVEIPVPGSGGASGSSDGSAEGTSDGSGSAGTSSADEGSGGSGGPPSTGSQSASSGGSSIFGDLLGSVRVVFDVLIGFFLTLAFMFLYLKNGAAMWAWVLGKLGGRVREDADAAGRAAWSTVGAYVRGLTVVALFDAVGIGVGLLLLGVPLALTLALLQFVASYIPTIGALVAGAVAVAIAWASGGATTALFVLILVIVVQQVGNDVIEPYVMGRELPINAFVVLAAVTAGGLLWGIAGALLFVPLTAAVTAAGQELWERRGRRPVAGAG